jgi:hypothetical protein
MADALGFEPRNAGVKVPCVRPLHHTPINMVTPPGIEPGIQHRKCCVLPLDHGATNCNQIYLLKNKIWSG